MDTIRAGLLVARRATYVVDGRFFAHFFWKVEGTVRIHVNSRVAHVWLPCRMVAEAIPNFGKLGKFGKLQIFIKVVGSISGHIGSHEWQPSWIIKDGCHLIKGIDMKGIFGVFEVFNSSYGKGSLL